MMQNGMERPQLMRSFMSKMFLTGGTESEKPQYGEENEKER